jgi:hypothetical protein
VTFRFAMMEKAAVRRGRGRRSGEARVVDQTAGMAEYALKCLPVGSTRARRSRREPQNSVKRGSILGLIDRG